VFLNPAQDNQAIQTETLQDSQCKLEADKNKFSDGDLVLLQDRKARRYLTTLTQGQVFHCHLGRLAHDGLIGHSVGGWYRTDRGHSLLAVRPTLGEFVRQMSRGPQIIYS